MDAWLERQWYGVTAWRYLLWPVTIPLSWLFCLLVWLRRKAYATGVLHSWHAPVPVVVVGNITVGGTGKTPLTLWLARYLRSAGCHPGIVSRGYGGRMRGTLPVTAASVAAEVGDEPLLMARRGSCPVWVGRDRPAAVRALLRANPRCDVVLCDDGLQHYALARDVEIAVIDGRRGLGNGRLLPAGPLREPASRLRQVDAVVMHGAAPAQGGFDMRLVGATFRNVADPARTAGAEAFIGLALHAVAGIGYPQRFFDQLAGMGLHAEAHAFPDHHAYRSEDLQFPGAQAILMTEKDAVKCRDFAGAHCWYLEVDAEVSDALGRLVLDKIRN